MTPTIALQLWREQERLEQLGWEFPVWWSRTFREFNVTARQLPSGPAKSFYATTRQELMQQALQWAAEQDLRDTLPVPAMVAE